MRPSRVAGALVACVGLLMLTALPARADNTCKNNPADCDNTAGVVGTVATITATVAVTTTLVRRRKPGAKDTDVCKELVSQYQQKYSNWQKEHEKFKANLRVLNQMYQNLRLAEEHRQDLIREQQSAMGLMLGAGAAAGAALGAAFAAFCSSVAAGFTASAETGMGAASLAGETAGLNEAFLALGRGAAADTAQAAWWSARAAGSLGTGAVGGTALGAAAGKVLEETMEKGLADFSAAVARQEAMAAQQRMDMQTLAANATRSKGDLIELANRLDAECGLEMEKPADAEYHIPESGGSGGMIRG